IRHLVRGHPLPPMARSTLPAKLASGSAVGLKLRAYQWEGISWIDFLRRIGAHGILADDMGLGKTIQALMGLALAHFDSPGTRSLVVCPPTMVNHWKVQV
ncbi:unnamed protein product, partial [Discosporangium mesarthrocarpum]